MPFVEVWVDDACECQGDCKRGKEADQMDRQIEAALVAIVQGRAHEVEAILRGEVYLPPRPSAQAQKAAYADFKARTASAVQATP